MTPTIANKAMKAIPMIGAVGAGVENKPPKIAPKKITLKGREDLTFQPSLLFKSWECKNSPSLPALYAEPFEGGFKLWIHVPAVSERINLGSKLDEWIRNRSKSICFGKTWKNLLSPKNCEASSCPLSID